MRVISGSNGIDGPIGQPGEDFIRVSNQKGPKGISGAPGSAGLDGPDGQPGAAGKLGAVGSIGPVGSAGADGSNGAMGENGIQGMTGNDAQYCPCPARTPAYISRRFYKFFSRN